MIAGRDAFEAEADRVGADAAAARLRGLISLNHEDVAFHPR
jgi:hypothetical protein